MIPKGRSYCTRERVPQGFRCRSLEPAGRVTKGLGLASSSTSRRRLVLKDWFVMNNLSFLKFLSVCWVPKAS